jgi:23S rRNA (guanine745-N1)-methyltransferase
MKGRSPGDSADMLAARRALFDAGHYRPVQQAVAAAVAERRPGVVLDAGCGEGTYLAAVEAPARLGIDVARPGIRLAARRFRDCRFAVASSFQLPVDDGSVDAVLSVFAPRAFAEFARVLRRGGVAVLASPGPDHLAGLTEQIYGTRRPHEQRPHTADDPELPDAPVERVDVRYVLALRSATDVANLVRMTPYWWKATPEQQAALVATDALDTVVDIVVTVHELA